MGLNIPATDLTVEDYEGISTQLGDFCWRNNCKPDIIEFVKWVKNRNENTYSKLFVVILANGAEAAFVTEWSLTEKELFKRKLKHG